MQLSMEQSSKPRLLFFLLASCFLGLLGPSLGQSCPSGDSWAGAQGDDKSGFSHATFYTSPDAGNCGYGNLAAAGIGYDIAAVSDTLYMNYGDGALCGQCFEISCCGSDYFANACTGQTVIITVTDRCPAGGNPICINQPHFDLSTQAFNKIANPAAGILKVQYKRVDCPHPRSATIIGWNSGWLSVTMMPSASSVSFSIDGGSWLDMYHDFGGTFKYTSQYSGSGSGSVSFKVKDEDGTETLLQNCIPSGNWQWGKKYECNGGSASTEQDSLSQNVLQRTKGQADHAVPKESKPKKPKKTSPEIKKIPDTFEAKASAAWHVLVEVAPSATTKTCKDTLETAAGGSSSDIILKASDNFVHGSNSRALKLIRSAIVLVQGCAKSLKDGDAKDKVLYAVALLRDARKKIVTISPAKHRIRGRSKKKLKSSK